MAIIFGFLITIQLKLNLTSEGIITIQRLLDMENDVNNVLSEISNLKQSVAEAGQKLKEYEDNIGDDGSIYDSMENELKKIRNYAGLEKVEGPGIIITLNDSLESFEDAINPELFLIHDIDVLEIVNDLKAAGAEAISINDVRIISTTSIKCGGPTININNSRHATPFIIKAIGDAKTLEATALAPDGYIDWMEYSGIRIDVKKVDNLTINKYTDTPRINYQKIVEGGV
ncbi:MAG: DUF881 domain-containing protein [Firmicutes bacterium]|nr:DUF881 domain-containing protein [Bacillota bacterium]